MASSSKRWQLRHQRHHQRPTPRRSEQRPQADAGGDESRAQVWVVGGRPNGATGCSRHDSLLLLLLLPRERTLRRRNLFSAAPCTDRRPRFLNVAVAAAWMGVVAEMGCEMHAEGDSNARMRPREGARVRGSQGSEGQTSTGTTAAWGMWGVQATLAAAGSNTVRPLHASWVGTAGSSTPTTHRPAAQLFLC